MMHLFNHRWVVIIFIIFLFDNGCIGLTTTLTKATSFSRASSSSRNTIFRTKEYSYHRHHHNHHPQHYRQALCTSFLSQRSIRTSATQFSSSSLSLFSSSQFPSPNNSTNKEEEEEEEGSILLNYNKDNKNMSSSKGTIFDAYEEFIALNSSNISSTASDTGNEDNADAVVESAIKLLNINKSDDLEMKKGEGDVENYKDNEKDPSNNSNIILRKIRNFFKTCVKFTSSTIILIFIIMSTKQFKQFMITSTESHPKALLTLPHKIHSKVAKTLNLEAYNDENENYNIAVQEETEKEETTTITTASAGDSDIAQLTSCSKEEGKQNQDPMKSALSFISDAFQKVGPSVVNIDTVETRCSDELLGQGSGLIFSSDGLVLTNAHVVTGAGKVTVSLTDGRIYQAEVKGLDEYIDIAVLKIIDDIDTNDIETVNHKLPVAELGDSDSLNVGQLVIAVGNPGRLDNTVTMGIVSGLRRSSTVVGIPERRAYYIQTDASINPGNSGGPLVDVESGQVIGINTVIRANMEGTSFSIPINRVREIMNDLAEGKRIEHGCLGVSLSTLTPEVARDINLHRGNTRESSKIPEVRGAIVKKVFPQSPAETGGLRKNDIILKIKEETISSADDALKIIDSAEIGEDLSIVIYRNKNEFAITVKPADLAIRQRDIRRECAEQRQQQKLRSEELGPSFS